MINNRQQLLKCHVQSIQSRTAAMTALFMTIFLLCIEHVRAFANQYHITAHDAMVLASAANGLRRKLSTTYMISPDTLKKSTSFGFFSSHTTSTTSDDKTSDASRSSATKLNAWSMGLGSLSIDMPSMPTSKDMPIHTLGSWYTSVDPTTKPPVYDE